MKYRLIALDLTKIGGFGEQRRVCESFIIESNLVDNDVILNTWQAQNPQYKALHLSKILDNLP